MTLHSLLKTLSRKYADKEVIVHGEQRLTFSQLDSQSNKGANVLFKLGLQKGDRVVLLLPTSADFLVHFWAVVKAGGIVVPIDPRFSPEEVDFLLQDSEPRVIIGEGAQLSSLSSRYKEGAHMLDLSSSPSLAYLPYQEMLRRSSERRPDVKIEPQDIAWIRYTSGTTGRPKGAIFSHKTQVAGPRVTARALEHTEKDIDLMPVWMPPGHCFPTHMVSLLSGATTIILPPLTTLETLEVLEREGVTIFWAMPAFFMEMVNMPEKEAKKYDLSSLRLYFSVGGVVPSDVNKRFKERFEREVSLGYSTSESVALVTVQSADGDSKPGSAGKVVPGFNIKILGENGKKLPPTRVGELAFKGPGVMGGYYNRPQATAEALKRGWFFPGDVARIDKEGNLFIMGRKKEVISVAGHSVFAADVEEILYSHPEIKEAAVVGVPSKTTGEAVKAVIVLKEGQLATAQEILAFCRPRLTDYEMPQSIEFRLALPKTPSGKVRRQELIG